MDVREIFGLAGVPLIIALVEVVKRAFPGMKGEMLPLVSLLFGVAINVAVGYYLKVDIFPALVTGVVAGLAASGLYSGGKAVVGAGS